jgi:diguanylate cyclase (GGDEF)-like protein
MFAVVTVNCPEVQEPALRGALLDLDLLPVEAELDIADLVLVWLDPCAAGAEVEVARLREHWQRQLPALVAVAPNAQAATLTAAAALGLDCCTAAATPEELAAVCRLVGSCRGRFLEANPLTGLPGNNVLDQAIQKRLPQRGELAILAFDLDHFKGYNDRYGYRHGDTVLRWLGSMLATRLHATATRGWLLCHLGGDDFYALMRPGEAQAIAQVVIEAFDQGIGEHYEPQDRAAGQITTVNRRGETVSQPLLSLTVAAVFNQADDVVHAGQVAGLLAELKKYGKSLPGSCYVPDRRQVHEVGRSLALRDGQVEGAQVQPTAQVAVGGGQGKMAQRILFVDDERDLVQCAKVFLEQAGYEFEGAYDGLQAIQKVQEQRPALIILDVNMPRLTGWDVLQALQRDPETADIPVLMLTAKSQDQDKARGWELGCTWYHTKPFDFDDLIVVIERILAATAD